MPKAGPSADRSWFKVDVKQWKGPLLGGSSHDGRKWLITIVSKSPKWGNIRFQMAFSWLINGWKKSGKLTS